MFSLSDLLSLASPTDRLRFPLTHPLNVPAPVAIGYQSVARMFRRILHRTLRSCAGSFGPCAAQGPALLGGAEGWQK